MKKRIMTVWMALALAVSLLATAYVVAAPNLPDTAVPRLINYQGVLTDPATGDPLPDGNYPMTFSLYEVATGGTPLWSETQTVSVEDGLFTVLLGSAQPLELEDFTGTTYLGVKVGADPEMTPRQQVVSVAYALQAQEAANANTVDGQHASAFAPATHQHDARYWLLTGNAGTNPATHFLGTTDNQALELRVNNARALRLEPNATSPNLIGGYSGNSVTAGVIGATIGGGGSRDDVYGNPEPNPNRVTDNYGTVGGGMDNQAGNSDADTTNAYLATVGGGEGNTASSFFATVGGGGGNTASIKYATVGGGGANIASGDTATIGGGWYNTASNDATFVGGGEHNTASGWHATVGGGWYNTANGYISTVGGGQHNTASEERATIGGGASNEASGSFATIGGGRQNIASGGRATVGGGEGNTASDWYATVSGGLYNTANGSFSAVGGGQNNQATADYATIAGGGRSDPVDEATGNRVTDNYGTVGGGGNNRAGNANANTADAIYATIGGGWLNTASAHYATVGGGDHNTASGNDATISGGHWNTASGINATIGGGYQNTANGGDATIGGGEANTASGSEATIGGGEANTASGSDATVSGGYQNTASGFAATVPGGTFNTALGDYSLAAGRRAKANNKGCFVWGDSSSADVTCNNDNRWVARASGGVYFYTNSSLTTGSYLAAGGNAWNAVSDRATKENLTPVDDQAILERLAALPLQEYNLKSQDPSIRHLGPVAQDFYAAFGYGESDRAINMEDADGVALAAIQGLYQMAQEQEAQIAAQRQRIDDLEARLAALEARSASPVRFGLWPGVFLLGLGLVLSLPKGRMWWNQRRNGR